MGSGSGSMNISRVDQNTLDQQFTATDLIGKDVYDNAGQKIGEVKDVVLGSAAGSHLAMAFASGSGDTAGSSGSTGSGTYGSTSGTGSSTSGSGSGTTAGGATGSRSGMASTSGSGATGSGSSMDAGSSTGAGTGSTTGSGSMGAGSGWASQAHGALSGLTSEPAAIVSVGGFMGVGGNMVRVPLSQLNYDQSARHLTVAISQNEISSLTDTSGSRGAAE